MKLFDIVADFSKIRTLEKQYVTIYRQDDSRIIPHYNKERSPSTQKRIRFCVGVLPLSTTKTIYFSPCFFSSCVFHIASISRTIYIKQKQGYYPCFAFRFRVFLLIR